MKLLPGPQKEEEESIDDTATILCEYEEDGFTVNEMLTKAQMKAKHARPARTAKESAETPVDIGHTKPPTTSPSARKIAQRARKKRLKVLTEAGHEYSQGHVGMDTGRGSDRSASVKPSGLRLRRKKGYQFSVADAMKGGKRGGKARAAKLSPALRKQIAQKAAKAKWEKYRKKKRSGLI